MHQIKQIYISNILECFRQNYVGLSEKEQKYWEEYDIREANRSLYYGGDDKVVITSVPIEKEHFGYTCDLFKWKNVKNLYPQKYSYSICLDVINDEKLRNSLIEIIEKNPGLEIVIPYRATNEFQKMVDFLRSKKLKFKLPESSPDGLNLISYYGNSKAGFRHLWNKALKNSPNLEIDLAEGFVVGEKSEVIDAALYFVQRKKSFVIKCNKGTQGVGVIFNKYNKIPHSKTALTKYINKTLSDKLWDNPVIVVEEMLDTDENIFGGSPSIEFQIKKKNKIDYLYPCEQILASDRKTFAGVLISPELYQSRLIKIAKKGGLLYAKELARLGYRGCFDVDLIVTKAKKIYAVESNLRRTGGTHVFEAARSLLGADKLKKSYTASEDIHFDNSKNLDYLSLRNKLKNLLYDPKSKQGIIFGNPSLLKMGIFFVIYFASNGRNLKALRESVRKMI